MAKGKRAAARAARVAIVRTRAASVGADYQRLLELSGCAAVLSAAERVTVYGNLTWSRFFPAVSSPPWQLSGVAGAVDGGRPRGWRWLAGRGHTSRPNRAARANRWPQALRRHGQTFEPVRSGGNGLPLPHGRSYFVLDRLIGARTPVPEDVRDSVALHLPTYKTHGLLGLAGALENAWATWLPTGGAAAAHPHEVAVDLLLAQQQVHPAVCVVMDGTLVGDGAGPRTVDARNGGVLLASTDPVALDAVAARLAGFDPFGLRYLALAYALGLGYADAEEIEVVGDDVSDLDLRLHMRRTPAAVVRAALERLGQVRLEERLLRPRGLLTVASNLYYDYVWLPTVGRPRLRQFRRGEWGRLFASYST